MNARDYRLDDGVKVARRMNWLIGDDEWPDAPSTLDVLDGLVDDSDNPPFPPARAADVTQHPLPPLHGFYTLFDVAIWVVAGGAVVSLIAALWFMAGGAA